MSTDRGKERRECEREEEYEEWEGEKAVRAKRGQRGGIQKKRAAEQDESQHIAA